jgi:hypothetical protein
MWQEEREKEEKRRRNKRKRTMKWISTDSVK